MAKPPLTFRRLSGLDRTGPDPIETQAGQPLRPWTIPNAIGYVRIALIPAFLIVAFSSGDGTSAAAVLLFLGATLGDYADGIAARVTGQYSRLGALMDPAIDRAAILAGVVVCWHFELLPRWALALLAAREAFMLLAGPYVVRRGVVLHINWPGRWSVWPLMGALGLGLCGVEDVAAVLLYVGVALSLWATVLYGTSAVAQLRQPSTSA